MISLPRTQRGAATVIAAMLLVTVILTIGLATVRLSSTDVTDSSLQRHSVEALFLAETGLENATQQLANGASCDASLIMGSPTVFGNGDFQITDVNTSGSLCQVTVTGRRLYGTVAQASRTIEGDIQMAGSSGGAIAVGDNGTILQWDGSAWMAMASGTTADLRGIDCVSDTSCMAVGNNGAALTWDGSSWTGTGGTTGFTNHTDVACVDSLSDCHASATYWIFGVMARWTGGPSWALINGVWFSPYNSVTCATSACYSILSPGYVLQWNGATWVSDANLGNTVNDITCPSDVGCWAVGNAISSGPTKAFTIYERNGGIPGWDMTFNDFYYDNKRRDLYAIDCIAFNDCWAVGARQSASEFTLLQRNGGSWSLENWFVGGGNAENLYGVNCASSDGTCWAVGANGAIIYYDGSNWSSSSSGVSVDLYDVYSFDGSGGSGSVGLVGWREIIA